VEYQNKHLDDVAYVFCIEIQIPLFSRILNSVPKIECFVGTKNRMLLPDKLENGPTRVFCVMSQKRARSVDSVLSEDDLLFNFDLLSRSHSVPGTTDAVLEVLRDMSNCNERKSTDGHTINITVGEFYHWC